MYTVCKECLQSLIPFLPGLALLSPLRGLHLLPSWRSSPFCHSAVLMLRRAGVLLAHNSFSVKLPLGSNSAFWSHVEEVFSVWHVVIQIDKDSKYLVFATGLFLQLCFAWHILRCLCLPGISVHRLFSSLSLMVPSLDLDSTL